MAQGKYLPLRGFSSPYYTILKNESIAPNGIAQGSFTSPPSGSRTPETMTAGWYSTMCGAEELFYVNITRDDVKTLICVSVWAISFPVLPFYMTYNFE